jgi:hypothetical protein
MNLWYKDIMGDFLTFDIQITETIDILCYEGNYWTICENEDKLCHYYKITPVDKNIVYRVNKDNILEYDLYINKDKKEIELYNFDDGDSIIFDYLELEEINYGHEQIISSKIKYLINEYNNLHNKDITTRKTINNILTYFGNELENTERKIDFFKENDNAENLYRNIGKKEMINIIIKKLEDIK